jgi:hypothetical protein
MAFPIQMEGHADISFRQLIPRKSPSQFHPDASAIAIAWAC